MEKKRELKASVLCPCSSGLTYGNCCKQQSIRWVQDKSGNIYKELMITPEMEVLFKEAEQAFLDIFERKPRANDPVFLMKYLVSDEGIRKDTTRAMYKAGVQSHLIYAYQKTGGLLVTEHNEKNLTGKDREEWESSIQEFFELNGDEMKKDIFYKLFSILYSEIDKCIITLGYVLEYGFEENGERQSSSSDYFSVDDYVLVCATKSIKTLRAVKALLEDDIGSDALLLCRHLFENYLHIIFAKSQPEMLSHLVDARVGLNLGTHRFDKHPNGKPNTRFIIRISDGKKFDGNISNYRLVSKSPYPEDASLFDCMYSFLSGFAHPSISSFHLVLGKNGRLDHLDNELQFEALYLSVCFSAMILDELRSLKILSEDVKKDITTVTRRIRDTANAFCHELFKGAELPESFNILLARLSSLGGSIML